MYEKSPPEFRCLATCSYSRLVAKSPEVIRLPFAISASFPSKSMGKPAGKFACCCCSACHKAEIPSWLAAIWERKKKKKAACQERTMWSWIFPHPALQGSSWRTKGLLVEGNFSSRLQKWRLDPEDLSSLPGKVPFQARRIGGVLWQAAEGEVRSEHLKFLQPRSSFPSAPRQELNSTGNCFAPSA